MPERGQPNSENFNPLHKKYPELHKDAFVKQAAERQEEQTGEPLRQPSEKLNAWMNTLHQIHIDRDPVVTERIKAVYHGQYVMQSEQVPEAYFELQKRIAREQGHGDVEIPASVRQEMAETITRDQERSLDAWIDYLSSSEAAYPMWFKYYTFRNVVKLADLDKEKGEFKKRSNSTTAPFPDINREALAYMADSLTAHYQIKDRRTQAANLDPKTQDLLDHDASFAKLYAHTIEQVHPATAEELAVTDGHWVKYDQGTEGVALARTLQGHGTGWCTAGEGTAQAQLDMGDFYVYYTKNQAGEYTTPRVAIRMQGNQIGEVRGIQADQNLEPALVEIAQTKMAELPGSELYLKRSADMQALTAIELKSTTGQELSAEELRFLYQIDRPIEGFGYQADPRIAEIQESRNRLLDFATIFHTDIDHIATSGEQLNQETIVYMEESRLLVEQDFNEQYPNLLWIDFPVIIDGRSLSITIAKQLISAGQAESVARMLPSFEPLDSAVAEQLIKRDLDDLVVRYLDRFEGMDHQGLANQLLASGDSRILALYFDRFKNLNHDEIANRLIEAGEGEILAENLHKFQAISTGTFYRLIDNGYGDQVIPYIHKFGSGNYQEVATRMIQAGDSDVVARNAHEFTGVGSQNIANQIIDTGGDWSLLENLDNFIGLDTQAVANKLIESGLHASLATYLDKFKWLDEETANSLIDAGMADAVVKNIQSFSGLNASTAHHLIKVGKSKEVITFNAFFKGLEPQDIANRLIEAGQSNVLALFPDWIKGLNSETADKLISLGRGYSVLSNLDRFLDLDHQEIADRLIALRYGLVVVELIDKLKGINHQEIADNLIDTGQGELVIHLMEEGISLDHQEIARRLISKRESWVIERNLELFEGLDEAILSQLRQAE